MRLHGSNTLNRKEIDLLISHRLNLVWFPQSLEYFYQTQYQQAAANEFRYRAPFILILYLLLSFGIYQTLPENQISGWFLHYIWVGIIIFVAWLFSLFKSFHAYFEKYACFGSALAVAITFIIVNTNGSGQNNTLYHVAMMYAVVIIYAFVGMRFYTALLAGWLGGILGIICSHALNNPIDWTVLNRTYTFSSFLGMALAYASDRQHRENFLQNCIIELNRLELVQQAQKMAALSQQDSLTGLANRRYLDEVLMSEWDLAIHNQFPITVMMVDIDFFKLYNDSLGHIAGDECLRQIASTIASLACRRGEIAARYGGEEFLLVFPMLNEQEAVVHAKRLMEAVKMNKILHPCSDVSDQVTISIGLATTIPKCDSNISSFIAKADHALYIAKSNGRNQFHVSKQEFSKKVS